MTIAASFKPVTMHHATETPVIVETQAKYDELAAAGWTVEYQHQAFPSVRSAMAGARNRSRTTSPSSPR